MLKNKEIGFLLLITHLLSSITIGILLSFKKTDNKNYCETENSKISENINVSEILKQSIQTSILNILTIGGFIILSSVCIAILEQIGFFEMFSYTLNILFGINKELIKSLLYGIFEVTNGINNLAMFHRNTRNHKNIFNIIFTWFWRINSYHASFRIYI